MNSENDGLSDSWNLLDSWLAVMNFFNRHSKAIAVLLCAPIVVQLYRYYYHHNNYDELEYLRQLKADFAKKKKQREESHKKALLKMQLLHEKDDAELHEKQIARHNKNLELWKKQTDEFIRNSQEDEAIYSKKRLESNQRIQKFKSDAAVKNLLQDTVAKFQTTMLKSSGERELEDMQSGAHRESMKWKAEVEEANAMISEASDQFRKDQQETKRQEEQENLLFQQKLRETEERLSRGSEKIRLAQEHQKRHLEQQLRQIEKVLMMKMWNEAIEFNWTNRLNTLRDSNRDVETIFLAMLSQPKKKLMEAYLSHLLEAVKAEEELMRQEANEMERMHKATGKDFLLTIKSAVEDVSEECRRFSDALKSDVFDTKHTTYCFTRLRQAAKRIPTLAELKTD